MDGAVPLTPSPASSPLLTILLRGEESGISVDIKRMTNLHHSPSSEYFKQYNKTAKFKYKKMIKNILLGAITLNVDAVVSLTNKTKNKKLTLNWLDEPERFSSPAGEKHQPLVGQ